MSQPSSKSNLAVRYTYRPSASLPIGRSGKASFSPRPRRTVSNPWHPMQGTGLPRQQDWAEPNPMLLTSELVDSRVLGALLQTGLGEHLIELVTMATKIYGRNSKPRVVVDDMEATAGRIRILLSVATSESAEVRYRKYREFMQVSREQIPYRHWLRLGLTHRPS